MSSCVSIADQTANYVSGWVGFRSKMSDYKILNERLPPFPSLANNYCPGKFSLEYDKEKLETFYAMHRNANLQNLQN